jgi:hypothetical protein
MTGKIKKTAMECVKTMTNTRNVQGSSRDVQSLDSRYGEIGIPAVAAALQYGGDAKTAGAAPAAQPQNDRWHADLAA